MKKLKLTKKQYESLVKAGLIKESMNIVDKQFKKGLAGKDVHNLKYIPEEKIELGSKFNLKKPIAGIKNSITEEVNNLLEYIYGLNEEFSTFWENYNLTYEDLCEALESKGYLVKKEGVYRVSKKMGDVKSVKEGISQTLTEMLGPLEEVSNLPAGAEFDPNAPWNRQEPKRVRGERPSKKFVEIKYSNPEIAIFKDLNSGELYVFYYGDIDSKLLEPYVDRYGTLDPEGDIEFDDDYEVDDDVLENYVNDNFQRLRKGEGSEDFESGKFDLILINEELKDDLLHLYDKDSRLVMVLEPIAEGNIMEEKPHQRTPEEQKKMDYAIAKISGNKIKKDPNKLELPLDDVDESTGAASSGAYVGLFSPSKEQPKQYDYKKLPPVVAEMDNSAPTGSYDVPGLVGISRDGKFPTNPKKTKAQQKTQWAGGAFVKMDDCTKLNNNKKAQNGGCSAGAADNVVKLQKTKGNINAPSLSEGKKYTLYKLDRIVKKNNI